MGSDPIRGEASYTVCTCGTRNDPDARFCKNCGAKLEAV
jgi:ribosomal protein L40E